MYSNKGYLSNGQFLCGVDSGLTCFSIGLNREIYYTAYDRVPDMAQTITLPMAMGIARAWPVWIIDLLGINYNWYIYNWLI